MKRIVASEDGHRTSVPNAWTDVDVVTVRTRIYEAEQAGAICAGRRPLRGWRGLVRNRIAFRHDDKRGPISATLIHAIY